MNRRTAGFTLLEVMVALAVVAIALGSLLAASGQSARTAAHLKHKTIALWVASNLLAEVSLAGAPPVGEVRGSEVMAGRTWYWTRGTYATGERTMFEVRVRIFEQPLAVRPGKTEAALADLRAMVRRVSP